MSDKPIGYQHPPVHSRFKKGQSGNPGGRKKGNRNLKTVLTAVMESEVQVSDNGKKRIMPLKEALLWRQAQCGMAGEWKASESLFDRYERLGLDRAEPECELAEEDAHMLEQFLLRGSSRRPSANGREDDDE